MTDEVLVSRKLRKEYGATVALEGADLSVRKGEIFGLLGVNGAGKTTWIRMMCGLTAPTSGSGSVCGFDISAEKERVHGVIGVSPQETAVAANLTVRENLAFIAEIYNVPDAKARTAQIAETFSLAEVMDKRAKTLSGGWQRRLSIALALLPAPQVLFLDEPTLGLDILARRELWKTIEALRGKTTVILTSHYLEEIEHLCTRVAILASGKVLKVGTVEEIKFDTGAASFEDAFVKTVEGGANP